MWQKLSLRMRLIALFALVLILGLAINIGRLLLEAGPRVQAEDESVIRLAREFIEASVVDLKDSEDPEAALAAIVGGLQRLRHVTVTREGEASRSGKELPGATGADGGPGAPPPWFIALVRPEQATQSVPIVVEGKSLGSLVIASHPTDEIAEIWDGIVTQVEIGSALAVALFLVTIVVVSRALAPIQSLADAMASIEAGRYDTRVVPTGSAEIADICDKLNHLANALGNAVEEKQHLAERVVSLQDVERKEIARELHDEFGPYLFALRAHATSLMRVADIAKPDIDGVRRHGNAMLDQVNALQQFNRRVLEKLRPAGLSELGLNEALGALVRLWRDAHPGVVVETGVSQFLGDMGETAELTIYRIVQEALTNVFRHSGATHVTVTIEPKSSGNGVQGGAACVRVQDNGEGLPSDHKFGLGLTGMRERVMALGGTMTVASTEDGLTVEAVVPRAAHS
jgi:two-component system, NarL family, sensor histidine kinase UhpB